MPEALDRICVGEGRNWLELNALWQNSSRLRTSRDLRIEKQMNLTRKKTWCKILSYRIEWSGKLYMKYRPIQSEDLNQLLSAQNLLPCTRTPRKHYEFDTVTVTLNPGHCWGLLLSKYLQQWSVFPSLVLILPNRGPILPNRVPWRNGAG